ncbi:MAG: glycerol-3-phosphate dehydrogenase/oxidase [Sulfitobacter sp.]
MPSQRQNSFDALSQDESFDVVVVGGGINGIGVYRDLALQGLRVLLVERNDFCSGCSAAPSRMIHGGLRYLENGEFELVRESLGERDALLKNAPHFVRPLPTTIPITSVFSGALNAAGSFLGRSGKPAPRGALPIKLGLTLYDWVTRKNRALPKHKFQTARATQEKWPDLMPDLRFSATYHDAWISYPERLGLEIVLDVAIENPRCVALSYAELSTTDGAAYQITDRQSGDKKQIKTKALVNATGAWLDEAISAISPQDPTQKPLVSGTKGSHLILDNPALMRALGGHMIYFENGDGRVCIIFPYLGKVLVGSTDIRVEAASRVRCEPDEQAYILEAVGQVFPMVPIDADQIVFSYSGIRPLPRSDQDFTGRISRGHFIKRIDGAVPQFCMVGGKWTTFRAFAEQTTDAVLNELRHSRLRDTAALAIGGGKNFPPSANDLATELVKTYKISPDRADHLAQSYGTRAHEVMRFCQHYVSDQPIASTCVVSTGEIAFLTEHEFVTSLSDVVMRRTDLAITGLVSENLINRICAIVADLKGWSAAQIEAETQTLIADLQNYHGVSAEMLKSRNT